MPAASLVESPTFGGDAPPEKSTQNKDKMEMLKKIVSAVALCWLLSFSLNGVADEIQDANKLFKQGQLDQALSKVDTYLAAKPKDAQGRFLKGLIVNEQGKPMEAISIFTALTNDYPELPEPYNNLAVLYAGQGQYEKAKVALEMAIRTHPSYATAHENLGDIYAKMASQAYDRALQLDKSNADTRTKLALIQDGWRLGGARALVEQILDQRQLGPGVTGCAGAGFRSGGTGTGNSGEQAGRGRRSPGRSGCSGCGGQGRDCRCTG